MNFTSRRSSGFTSCVTAMASARSRRSEYSASATSSAGASFDIEETSAPQTAGWYDDCARWRQFRLQKTVSSHSGHEMTVFSGPSRASSASDGKAALQASQKGSLSRRVAVRSEVSCSTVSPRSMSFLANMPSCLIVSPGLYVD